MKYLSILFLFSATAHAVNVQQYSRSNSLVFEMIEDARLEESHVYSDFNTIFNFGLSYVNQPLVVKSSDNSSQSDVIIKDMMNFHTGAAWYIYPWLQLGGKLNASRFKNNNGSTVTGLSDGEVYLKYRFFQAEKQALAFMPFFTIPSKAGGTEIIGTTNILYGRNNVLSDDQFGQGFKFIYEKAFTKFQMAVNLGYHHNSGAYFEDRAKNKQLNLTHRILSGIGFYVPLKESLGLNLEYQRAWSKPFFNDNLNPTELHVGLSTALSKNYHFFGGINFGNLLSSSDGNDYRILAGIKVTPSFGQKTNEAPITMKQLAVVKPTKCNWSFMEGSNSATVIFPKGMNTINDNQKAKLRELIIAIRDRDNEVESITINGHSSTEQWTEQSSEKNLQLSQERASVIQDIFLNLWPQSKNLIKIQPLTDSVSLNDELGVEVERRSEIIVNLKTGSNRCK